MTTCHLCNAINSRPSAEWWKRDVRSFALHRARRTHSQCSLLSQNNVGFTTACPSWRRYPPKQDRRVETSTTDGDCTTRWIPLELKWNQCRTKPPIDFKNCNELLKEKPHKTDQSLITVMKTIDKESSFSNTLCHPNMKWFYLPRKQRNSILYADYHLLAKIVVKQHQLPSHWSRILYKWQCTSIAIHWILFPT